MHKLYLSHSKKLSAGVSTSGTYTMTRCGDYFARLARVFIHATTDASTNSEDILPQDGGPDCDYSLFFAFSSLFPEVVRDISAEGAYLIHL